MSWQYQYVSEKLREFELEKRMPPRRDPPRKNKPIVGPVARRAGRVLKRIGAGLEQWGSPPAQDPLPRARQS